VSFTCCAVEAMQLSGRPFGQVNHVISLCFCARGYILSGIDGIHPLMGAFKNSDFVIPAFAGVTDLSRCTNGNKTLKEILQYLKTHGERLDTEIAEAVGLSLANARTQLTDLAAKREIMVCHSIRFENGKKIEGMKCRLAGFIPPVAPGRKSKSQLKIQ
jgi:hypothetical protein